MKHLDLFSGIGGFALAARNVGWETIGFCEIGPWAEPPAMTIREFAIEYFGSEEQYQDDYCDGEVVDFDKLMDPQSGAEYWWQSNSPNEQAFHLLEGLDLGPDLEGAKAVGEIRFIDGPWPGHDYLGVHAADEISLSLLQKRLNDLNTGARISMA